MASETNTQELAQQLFTGNKEDLLEKNLKRMNGWFDVSGGDVTLAATFEKAPKAVQYVAYLLACFVSHHIELRKTPFVVHKEVNGYFGWKKGRTATQFAYDHSNVLSTDDSGAKAVADGQLGRAIDMVDEWLAGNSGEGLHQNSVQ